MKRGGGGRGEGPRVTASRDRTCDNTGVTGCCFLWVGGCVREERQESGGERARCVLLDVGSGTAQCARCATQKRGSLRGGGGGCQRRQFGGCQFQGQQPMFFYRMQHNKMAILQRMLIKLGSIFKFR